MGGSKPRRSTGQTSEPRDLRLYGTVHEKFRLVGEASCGESGSRRGLVSRNTLNIDSWLTVTFDTAGMKLALGRYAQLAVGNVIRTSVTLATPTGPASLSNVRVINKYFGRS